MSGKSETEVDQYDAVCRSMQPGLLLTVNDSTPNSRGTPQLEVIEAYGDETFVTLRAHRGGLYRLRRQTGGELVVGEIDEDGDMLDEEYVETIEVIGIDG